MKDIGEIDIEDTIPENISTVTIDQESILTQNNFNNSHNFSASVQTIEKLSGAHANTTDFLSEASSESVLKRHYDSEIKTQNTSLGNDSHISFNDNNISLDQFNGTRWNCYWDEDPIPELNNSQMKNSFYSQSM